MLPYRSLPMPSDAPRSLQPLVTISVVSHGHGPLLDQVMADLARVSVPIEVLLTLNVPESHAPRDADPGLAVRRIVNATPKGFGANHNAAFKASVAPVFCAMNPDVRLPTDPFPTLLDHLQGSSIGVIGPRVTNAHGDTEDSARPFPTPLTLLMKAFGIPHIASVPDRGVSYPDWIAGMFMVFPRQAFEHVGGFDERYHLYYEDVDICARLQRAGYRVAYCADATVVHEARRQSRRDLRYARWHLCSMVRFLVRRALGRI